MQANELRIGNLIQVNIPNRINFPITRVSDIGLSGIKSNYLDGTLAHISVAPFANISPIPLTPELLRDLGFEVYTGANGRKAAYLMKDDFNRIILINWYVNGRIDITIDGYYSRRKTPHRYLHQLQNLYYACTLQELEFTLTTVVNQ